MSLWKHFHRAQSITDAVQALLIAEGTSCLVAGGTDLLLDIQQGRHPPVHTLVDVSSVPEMLALEVRRDELFVGAALPLNRLIVAPLAIEHAQALVEACQLVGGPQVRNTATLGGNVAHALPAADGTIALLALDAQAEIAGPDGCRRAPLASLFLGPGRSSLHAGREILVGFYIPVWKLGQASAFKRVMRPQGVALPILNMAVWIELAGDAIQGVRVSVGPSGPTPFRAQSVEAALSGVVLDSSSMGQAVQTLLLEARFRTSPYRASTDYRLQLAGALLEDTLMAAYRRARESLNPVKALLVEEG